MRGIYGFIGDAGEPSHREYNVALDPHAFVRLMRAELPFFWIPCFDGGVFTNNGHASFWRVRQRELLARTALPLQQYFDYMLRKKTDDPVACLSLPLDPEEQTWLMEKDRDLWCGALLGLTVGRPLRSQGKDMVGFMPVEVSVDDAAVIRYGKRTGSRRVMRFEIRDQAQFKWEATRATARLLESFPFCNRPER